MNKFTSKLSTNVFGLMSLLLFCSFFSNENAFSRNNWKRDFTKIIYDQTDNSILINFEFMDYWFGPVHENGYLQWCDFYFTTDGVNYTKLMKAETKDQGKDDWSWLTMKDKNIGTRLQLLDCYKPEAASLWPDNTDDLTVHVKNAVVSDDIYSDIFEHKTTHTVNNKAYLTVKWYLGDTYNDVKRIRINGFWKVNGVYSGDNINDVYYDLPTKNNLKSAVSKPDNNRVNVSTKANNIIIKGAAHDENIKVYNLDGKEIQSISSNSDCMNIKLPKNKIYIVNIGKARYKVAL